MIAGVICVRSPSSGCIPQTVHALRQACTTSVMGRFGIEAAGPSGELRSDGEKAIGEQVHGFVFKAEGDGREAGEDGEDALLGFHALPAASAGVLCLAFDGLDGFVVGVLTSVVHLGLKCGPVAWAWPAHECHSVMVAETCDSTHAQL